MNRTTHNHHTGGSSFIRGAAILGAAAMLSKLLGTLQKIPLQNIGGDAVFGIYNAVYQVYVFILTLATSGIAIAMSRYVSEAAVQGRPAYINKLLRSGVVLSVAVSAVSAVLLYGGASFWSELIGIRQAEPAFRAIAVAFCFVPLLSLFRGYFQGLQTMMPTAVSQIVEQLVRVVTMLVLIIMFVRGAADRDIIAAGAAFGTTTGGAAGLLIICVYFWRRRIKLEEKSPSPQADIALEGGGSHGRRFAGYALYSGMGALVLPLFSLVDALTIPRLLQKAGYDENQAAHAFGLYNHGLPLVQLVAMLAAAVASAIVPYVAEARAAGRTAQLQTYTELAVRYTWLIGLAAAAGLAVMSRSVNIMFYRAPEGWETVAVLAVTAWFSTLTTVTASLLQGLGQAGIPARNMLWATTIKIGCNLLLVSSAGITGAAWSAVLAFAIVALLNGIAVRRLTRTVFTVRQFIVRPLIAVGLMALFVWLILIGFHSLPGMSGRLGESFIVLAAVGGGAVLYGMAVIRLGCIKSEDFSLLGEQGAKLRALLKRLRLLEKE